jgi:hypothetical protein
VNNIITTYPAWALVLCPLIGLGYAALLYYKESRSAEFPKFVRSLLAALRFLAVAVLVFLLLGPLVRTTNIEIEPPIVVIAADNSSSLVLGPDSTAVRESIAAQIAALESSLGTKYEVFTYTFGQDVAEGSNLDFTAPVTDMSGLFQSLKNRFANRNLGAIVLASDGIYNRGANPRYATGGLGAPVYTIALGDTSLKRDAYIGEVALNRIAFLGNQFPLEVMLGASKLDGRTIAFSVEHRGKTVYSENISITGESFSKTLRMLLDADAPGRQQYTLRIRPIDGEAIVANNVRQVFIDVIDNRQKVLILANSPNPDIHALRQAISSNENYEVNVALLDDFSGDFSTYDLLVLHQIPSIGNESESLRRDLLKSEVPIFAIVGSQTVTSMLSRYGLGADLTAAKNTFSDVRAATNPNFSAFKLGEGLDQYLKDAPPIRTPFGTWRVSNSSETLLYQTVGNIATENPLMVINRMGERKTAVLLGEGLWRWRLYDFATSESHARFDGFIGSIVQYLSLKADKRLFRIQHEDRFMENERIVFSGELYNDSYEPVNEPDVNITIRDAEGKEYPFTFLRTDAAYRLDAGTLPVGNYVYTARTNRGSGTLEASGAFSVEPFALEAANLTANHNLLYTLSANTGGNMYTPDQVEQLATDLLNGTPLKPVSYSTEELSPVLNLPWIFVLLLVFLSLEWLLRKRSGGY